MSTGKQADLLVRVPVEDPGVQLCQGLPLGVTVALDLNKTNEAVYVGGMAVRG